MKLRLAKKVYKEIFHRGSDRHKSRRCAAVLRIARWSTSGTIPSPVVEWDKDPEVCRVCRGIKKRQRHRCSCGKGFVKVSETFQGLRLAQWKQLKRFASVTSEEKNATLAVSMMGVLRDRAYRRSVVDDFTQIDSYEIEIEECKNQMIIETGEEPDGVMMSHIDLHEIRNQRGVRLTEICGLTVIEDSLLPKGAIQVGFTGDWLNETSSLGERNSAYYRKLSSDPTPERKWGS